MVLKFTSPVVPDRNIFVGFVNPFQTRTSVRAAHVRTEAAVRMTSTLTPVSVRRDTQVSRAMKVSVQSVKMGHFNLLDLNVSFSFIMT